MNKYVKMFNKNKFRNCLILLLILFLIYKCFLVTKEGFQSSSSNSKDCVIRMFYVDWCGHCKKTKPQFKAFMDQNNNTKVNGTNVVVEMVDCEKNDANKQLAKKYNVNGYPTITAVRNGKEYIYNGPRETKDFTNWMKSIV